MLMRKFNFHYFPRDIDSGDLVENFLVSAIASILVIRLFLQITGFPILGGENFHIAHMLWGGFLMIVAVIGLLVFLNKETKYIASILGGIGFGTFIDELGKFITKDNNYFYQPTIGIIYVVFVLLFLGARVIEKYFRPNKQEYAINALDMTKQIIMHDLDVHEKERALYFLKQSDPDNPVVKMLTEALREVKTRSVAKKNLFHKIRDYVKTRYVSLIHYPKFIKLIITFFVIISVVNVLNALFNFSSCRSLYSSIPPLQKKCVRAFQICNSRFNPTHSIFSVSGTGAIGNLWFTSKPRNSISPSIPHLSRKLTNKKRES